MLSYDRLSKKPSLFKSFTGLILQEFDDIYKKEIKKRYDDYELQRLSKRKDRKRDIGAGRPFNLDLRNRFLMLLVYYRLYITYTLAGFLFNLDQSNICRDIQKIESLVRQCMPIPRKIYEITKRLKTPEEVEQYFPGFLAFIDNYIEIFKDQLNEFYVTLRINEHVEHVQFKSDRFKNTIRKEYYEQENQILSDDRLDGILKLIESQLMYNEDIKQIKLDLRVVKSDNDEFYYDLTNSKWEIIKITSEGWSIIKDNEIPIFKRYEKNCSPQVYPSREYDKNIFSNKFLKLFNVESKKEILLLSIYIISLFIPTIPKPILVLSGAGGDAKTTTFEIIKNIVDPGSIETLLFPTKTDDLIQTLSHHYVNFFDNVSSISEDKSDLLCRAVTGAGFSKRALFSNDDDFIYKFKRAIGVNSINLATTRADFLDRSLIIKLKRIDKKARRKKKRLIVNLKN